MEGRTIAESRVTLGLMMGPDNANALGNVHGGVIMKYADEAGAVAAMRHARRPVVTVAIDSLTFLEPITVGHLVTFQAELTYAGRTSMEVRVLVDAEDPITGRRTRTNMAYLVYVAIDENHRPYPVPALIPETPEEMQRFEEARLRQQRRKQERAEK
ncbi:MAG: acyl-CoA thioesterase [Anaerolineae bacterium]|nr:acyl-CoA thioesterase [Anaerolineae bacterium]